MAALWRPMKSKVTPWKSKARGRRVIDHWNSQPSPVFFLPSLNLSLSLSYFIGTRTRSDEGQKKNERKKEKGKGGENNTWPVFQTVVPYRHSFYQRKIVNNSFFIGLFRLGGTKLTVPSGFTGFYWVLLGFHEF